MPYSSSEFEVEEDAKGSLRVTKGDVASAILNALAQGENDLACRLYEESGRGSAEALLEKLKKAAAETRDAGAAMYAQARDFVRAAKLHEHAKNWPDAASLHAEGGDFSSAARCYKRAGDLFHAAQCADACGEVDEAISLYGELGDRETAADCLARNGRHLDAARLYAELGNTRSETEALRQVPKSAPDYVHAVRRLAELLSLRNRTAEAIELLTEAGRENEAARTDIPLHALLAELFDKEGYPDHAARLRARMARLAQREGAAASPHAPTHPSGLKLDAAAQLAAAPDSGYSFLKEIPLFARLTLDDMRDLYRLATEVTFTPGKHVITEGADSPGLVVLLEGTVDVVAVQDGSVRYLNSLAVGSYLGEISLISRSVTSARATASTLCRALLISPDKFDGFLKTHPRAALRIYELFAKDLAGRVRALSVV